MAPRRLPATTRDSLTPERVRLCRDARSGTAQGSAIGAATDRAAVDYKDLHQGSSRSAGSQARHQPVTDGLLLPL